MSTSAIPALRHMTGIMRGLSATVLLAFTMLILMPTVQAAQLPAAKPADVPAPAPPPDTDEDRLGRALQNAEETLARLEEKVQHGQKHAEEGSTWRRWKRISASWIRPFNRASPPSNSTSATTIWPPSSWNATRRWWSIIGGAWRSS
jgi:hypothetical protein